MLAKLVFGGRAFHTEGAARAKVPKEVYVWHVQERQGGQLEQRSREGGRKEVMG